MQHLQREDRGVHVQVRVFIGADGDVPARVRVGRCLGVFTGQLELLGTTVSWRCGVMIPFAHRALPTHLLGVLCLSLGAMSKECD